MGCVGNDGIGKMLRQSVKASGLLASLIQISPTHPTSIVLVSRSQSSPDFTVYRGADSQLEVIEQSLISAAIVHTTAFALSKKPAQTTFLTALQTPYALGKTISVDWNFAPSVWRGDDGWEIFYCYYPFAAAAKSQHRRYGAFFRCSTIY
ncbi:MAG TPA: PfkB family carbohydrate kinase [Flavisolibacter sp.]|nr:PfkB family carbohydrate kinase [Flavisolibacter sp.]